MVVGGAVSVGVHGPLDGVGNERCRSRDVSENFESVQRGSLRDAGADLSIDSQPGSRAGHVASVSVAVDGVGIRARRHRPDVAVGVIGAAGEVRASDHFGGGEATRLDDGGIVAGVVSDGPGASKIGVGVVDTGVDDGDPDVLPDAEVVPDVGGADPGHARFVRDSVTRHPGDGDHAREPADVLDRSPLDLDTKAVRRDPQPREHASSHRFQLRSNGRLLDRYVVPPLDLRGAGRKRVATRDLAAAKLRDRWTIQTHENLDFVVEAGELQVGKVQLTPHRRPGWPRSRDGVLGEKGDGQREKQERQ